MNLKPKHNSLIKLGLSFIIPYIALVLLIPRFFNVTLDQTMYGLFALGALWITFIIYWYKRSGHQGNSPMFVGLALMGLSAIPLATSISIQNSLPLIELDARSQGFTLMGLALGFIIFFMGAKEASKNSYFLGRGGR